MTTPFPADGAAREAAWHRADAAESRASSLAKELETTRAALAQHKRVYLTALSLVAAVSERGSVPFSGPHFTRLVDAVLGRPDGATYAVLQAWSAPYVGAHPFGTASPPPTLDDIWARVRGGMEQIRMRVRQRGRA